jgi:hypothetical protein
MAKKRIASIGECKLCSKEFSKSAMTRHLAKCLAEHAADVPAGGKGKTREILHFRVEGGPAYWLHLEAAAESPFATLDAFLRDIWLECCGHCSAFRVPEPKRMATVRCEKSAASLLEVDFDFDAMMRREEEIMESPLASCVKVGDSFHYEYDFGSTTELTLKVVGNRDGVLKRDEVRLLARNLPPDIRCQCGKPAALVCSECSWEPSGWLCKTCGKKHECGDEMFLPVVNSPRVGVCGYTGPDVGAELE